MTKMPKPVNKAAYEAFKQSLADPEPSNDGTLKAIIYGEPGVGKTVLSATLPGKFLYIDSLVNWVSFRNHPEIQERMTRIQYQGLSQLDMLPKAFADGVLDEITTIVLDEYSSMAVDDLDLVMEKRAKGDIEFTGASQPDYGINTERIRRSIKPILLIPKNVIIVAHVREDKDELSGSVTKRPSFSPKMRATLLKMCHLTGYMSADIKGGEVKRTLQLQPSRGIEAKNRLGGLPPKVENPNLQELVSQSNLSS